MDNKKLGTILVIIGVIVVAVILSIRIQQEILVDKIVEQEGSCFLDDGTCLHEGRSSIIYTIGWIIAAVVLALGLYMIFFEKSQKEILDTLEKHKRIQVDEEKLDILMKGLDEDEKRVIKAVKGQDGITQQTLRLRTDMHKSKLSIVLERLEKKGLIAREDKGKTKQVFLKIEL